MTGFFNLPKWMQAAAGLLVLVALIGIILLKPPAIVLLVLVGGIVFVVLLGVCVLREREVDSVAGHER